MHQHLKYQALQQLIGSMESLAVAYSGGVDSTFLIKTVHDLLGDKALAVTAKSATSPAREFQAAVELADRIGIKLLVLEVDELEIDGFSANTPNRCYLCKRHLFSKIIEIARQHRVALVADGTNADDSSDYRPGLQALTELGILRPLCQVGMGKQEIRDLSRTMLLPTWDKPAQACLASRFPYGQRISREKLAMVDAAELFLMQQGFRQIRVRHHGDIARIEVSPGERSRFIDEQLMDQIDKQFRRIGFAYTALDLQGYRSGSMNENLVELSDTKY